MLKKGNQVTMPIKNIEQKYFLYLSGHLHKHKCPQAHLQIMSITYSYLTTGRNLHTTIYVHLILQDGI